MEEQLKKTCLHDFHVNLGAKMSPFAGFDMPIQYSGIIDEHNAVRHAVGMFDVSHMGEIFISGSDSEKFINHIITNDVMELTPGKILYGMMLYPDGGTVDDLLVYKEFEPEHFLIVVTAANIDKDYGWMLKNAAGFDVAIDNKSDKWGQSAVQGPDAEKTLISVLGFNEISRLLFYEYLNAERDGSRVMLKLLRYLLRIVLKGCSMANAGCLDVDYI